MDEHVTEVLNALGYGKVTTHLADTIREFKKRVDIVCPRPLTLSEIVFCTMLYDMFTANKKA